MSNSLSKQITDWVEGLNYRRVVFALREAERMFNERFDLRTEKAYLLVILQKHIKEEKELRDLKSRVIENLAPNDCVDWVHQSKRYELWFENYPKIPSVIRYYKENISTYNLENLICNIDLFSSKINMDGYTSPIYSSLEEKRKLYADIKLDYETTSKYLKDFNWIKKDDEDLLNWCLDYLGKKNLLPRYGLTYPDSLAGKYDVIMVSIQLNEYNGSQRRYRRLYQPLKDKMHNAWTQKKWRDKKDTESALEYILSRKQFLKMLEISDKHNSKPIDLLNNWIDAEYKKLD